jgi:threonine dehydratase
MTGPRRSTFRKTVGSDPVISIEDVQAAARRLAGVAHRTPVLTSRTLDERVGGRVFVKCENLQRIGAYKFRGAYNTISRLDVNQLGRGVITFSSGNHAQAVALAAGMLGSKAVVVMPADTPASKREATAGYGAEIVYFDRYTDDRFAITAALAEERGLTVIPPFDHPDVMAGQGTAALELFQDVGPLDMLVTPVGGGALLAGSATTAVALHPGIRVIGVEPMAGDDTRRSLRAGRRVSIPVPRTVADAVTATIPGELTFEVNRRLVEDVVVVDDHEIVSAMRFLVERMKIVAEPAGALAIAALLAGRVHPLPERIGAVISGGNIDAERLAELFATYPAQERPAVAAP